MSIAPRGKRYFIRSLLISILLRKLALSREGVSPTSVSTHQFFLPVGSLFQVNIAVPPWKKKRVINISFFSEGQRERKSKQKTCSLVK